MTKYCSYFLKNISCPNNDCVFLHKIANEKDCFWREKTVGGLFMVPNNKVINFLIENSDKLEELKNIYRKKHTVLPNILDGIKEIENYALENNIILYKTTEIKENIKENIKDSKDDDKEDTRSSKTISSKEKKNTDNELKNWTILDKLIIDKLKSNDSNILNKNSRFNIASNLNTSKNSLDTGSLNILNLINDFVYNEDENHFKINHNLNFSKLNKIGEEVKMRKISLNENNKIENEFNLFCQKVKINNLASNK